MFKRVATSEHIHRVYMSKRTK